MSNTNRNVAPPVSAAAVALTEGGPASHTWEAGAGDTSAWEQSLEQDEHGNIVSTNTAGMLSTADAIRHRRKRLEQSDYAQKRKRVVRDMIRYMYVVVDASRWMRQKDPAIPPGTRLDVTLQLLQEFVSEYYDQNPLSHLGFIVTRNGEAEILSQLSSNAKSHLLALSSFAILMASEPPATSGGEFSLQNGLEVAGRSLGHQPPHGSREVVVLVGALSTCDPGHLLTETLPRLQKANIRVSTFCLTAALHVCETIAQLTHGVMGVCLEKTHYRDWLLGGQCTPPPAVASPGCEMVLMGFPTRTSADIPQLVHATRDTKLLARISYTCPQCQAKQSELPTDCVVCGLKLVLAPHLARSFHHLFPVPPFSEIPLDYDCTNKRKEQKQSKQQKHTVISTSPGTLLKVVEMDSSIVTTSQDFDRCCMACLKWIGIMDITTGPSYTNHAGPTTTTSSEVLRFQCPDCLEIFCADCDAYLHETLHNCPGCLMHRKTGPLEVN